MHVSRVVSPQLLGGAVLIYAALTALEVWLGLMGWLSGEPGWESVAAAVLWIGLVAGGTGLLGGRAWSRPVLLTASAGELALLAIMLFVSQASGRGGFLSGEAVFIAVWGLPPIGIIAATLLMRPLLPRAAGRGVATVSNRPPLLVLDIAYACFTWIVGVALVGALLYILPLDDGTLQVLGMVVGIPVALATLLILSVGVVLSLVLWREWPLPIMAVLLVGTLWLFFLEDSAASESWVVMAAEVSTVLVPSACAVLTGNWWVRARRRRA